MGHCGSTISKITCEPTFERFLLQTDTTSTTTSTTTAPFLVVTSEIPVNSERHHPRRQPQSTKHPSQLPRMHPQEAQSTETCFRASFVDWGFYHCTHILITHMIAFGSLLCSIEVRNLFVWFSSFVSQFGLVRLVCQVSSLVRLLCVVSWICSSG